MYCQAAKVAVAAVVIALMSACGSALGPEQGADDSELTAVGLSLPDRAGFKSQVADIETRMNAFRLVVQPVDPSCPGATRIDRIETYSNAATIDAKLKQDCDYDVTLELGARASDATVPSTKISYEGKAKEVLTRKCASCHQAGATLPDLSSYAAAKAAGASILGSIDAGRMPKNGSISAADKAILKAWQDGGYLERDVAAQPSSPSTTLGAVYFKNAPAARIKKEDIAGKAEARLSIVLTVQEAGRAIGLGKN